ncbi:hypothetical protein ACFX14_032314 [Malus domestica]
MQLQGKRWGGKIKAKFNAAKGTEYKGSIYDDGPTFQSYRISHGSVGMCFKFFLDLCVRFVCVFVVIKEEVQLPQLGIGRVQDKHLPQLLRLPSLSLAAGSICFLACGSAHVLALTSGGKVLTWGRDAEDLFTCEDGSFVSKSGLRIIHERSDQWRPNIWDGHHLLEAWMRLRTLKP